MEEKKKSHLWLKIAIGFGALSLLAVIGLVAAGLVLLQSVSSPTHVKSVASSFMALAEPLPEGFSYMAGYEVGALPIVQIEDDKTQALYTVTSASVGKQGDNSAKLTEEAKEAGLKLALVEANRSRLKPKMSDHLKFANETMYYNIGHTDVLGPDPTANNAFSGIAQSSKTGRYLFLWVQKKSLLQIRGREMDLSRIKQFLSAVKSF